MQIILSKCQQFQKVQFGFKRFSESQTKARKAKFYESRPNQYKRISRINKKIDFRSDTLKFPINVPLRYRWIYNPTLRQDIRQSDYLNFKDMTSNQILLHLENPQFMEISEFVSGFNELQKRDPENKYDLINHPWVQGAFQYVRKNTMYLKQQDVIRLMTIYYRLGVQDPQEWDMFHTLLKERFMNKMSAKGFGVLFILAFKDGGMRFPEEFRQELALLLPIHLRQLQGQHIGPIMKYIQDNKLMTSHLWERHFHQIIWKRPFWLAQFGSLPHVLNILIEMNYGVDYIQQQVQSDEFMYPDMYKALHSHVEQIPYEQLEKLGKSLEDFFRAFPHHSEYQIGELIRKLEERRTWENTLGQQAKRISLVQIV